MRNAIRSEWVKLTRRNMLAGFGGAMAAFTLLFTFLTFAEVGGGEVGLNEGGTSESFVSAASLSAAEGATFAVTQVAPFLGIIALALFASNLAGEFTKGTIRTLFVTQPHRLRLVAGKVSALALFLAAVMSVVVVVSVGLGVLMAPGAGVSTAEWWTSSGLAATGGAFVNLTVASLIPGLLGAALAVLTRSSAISISVGAAYFVLGESLIGAFWAPLTDWGPSASANVLALGGSTAGVMGGPAASMGYGKALVLAGVYMTVSLLVTSSILAKRDITS